MKAKTRSSTPTEQIRYIEKKSFPTYNSWHLQIQEISLGFAFSNGWWFEPWTYNDGTDISEFSAKWHLSTLGGENWLITERRERKAFWFLSFNLIHLIIAYSFWHWSKFFLACSNLLTVTISASTSLSVFKSIPRNTFLREKKILCQFQAITHCLLEILLVSETCHKTLYSVSLQHTSLKDLVGFNIPLADVVFKFIFNIMSCLSRTAN